MAASRRVPQRLKLCPRVAYASLAVKAWEPVAAFLAAASSCFWASPPRSFMSLTSKAAATRNVTVFMLAKHTNDTNNAAVVLAEFELHSQLFDRALTV